MFLEIKKHLLPLRQHKEIENENSIEYPLSSLQILLICLGLQVDYLCFYVKAKTMRHSKMFFVMKS